MGHVSALPARIGAHPLRLADSITEIVADDAGSIVVSGSHGGRSAAGYARAVPLALAVFNDAGVGKDQAGIVALDILDAIGMPSVAVGHRSARIGDARDTWDHGVISFVNDAARATGLRAGLRLRDEIVRSFG